MRRRAPLLALWIAGAAAAVLGYALLDEPTLAAVLTRSVGPSFLVCGLIAWQRRPDAGTGPLMVLTGGLFLAGQLLSEAGGSFASTLGDAVANAWAVPFAVLVLGFPGGRLSSRLDKAIVAGFAFGTVVLQVAWVVDHGVDPVQLALNGSLALALAVVAAARWLRAPPVLRRLTLPALAGAGAAFVLGIQVLLELAAGETTRTSREVTAVVLVAMPVAFLAGLLRAQLARAGMADLVVALQRGHGVGALGDRLGEILGDRSLEVAVWLPDRGCYVDAEGSPVVLPAAGGRRVATPVDRGGERVAALVHDAGLIHEPRLLEIVGAAAGVALERERLQAQLDARVEELAGSRARLVAAGDEARRRIERDLHDGAQQRLVSLAIALRLTEDNLRKDPETAAGLVAAARQEVSASLEELRELARGIHPAVLEHGLEVALDSLAARSPTPASVFVELDERLPAPVELAAYFVVSEALANVAKHARASHAAVRVRRDGALAVVEVADDGIGGADAAGGSGLRGLADRVEAAGGRLRVHSPPGGGTLLAAELPCQVRPAPV